MFCGFFVQLVIGSIVFSIKCYIKYFEGAIVHTLRKL